MRMQGALSSQNAVGAQVIDEKRALMQRPGPEPQPWSLQVPFTNRKLTLGDQPSGL